MHQLVQVRKLLCNHPESIFHFFLFYLSNTDLKLSLLTPNIIKFLHIPYYDIHVSSNYQERVTQIIIQNSFSFVFLFLETDRVMTLTFDLLTPNSKDFPLPSRSIIHLFQFHLNKARDTQVICYIPDIMSFGRQRK